MDVLVLFPSADKGNKPDILRYTTPRQRKKGTFEQKLWSNSTPALSEL
jgi:hypothetical protein